MNIIRDAVVLMPNREEHDKFATFLESYSDITWNGGRALSSMHCCGANKAYLIDDGKVLYGIIDGFIRREREYPAAQDNDAFLITVDEYIARYIGWDDVESETEFDFGDML